MINPCLTDRHKILVPLGDALAAGFDRFFREPTSDCPCCMMIRVIIVAIVAFGIGLLL